MIISPATPHDLDTLFLFRAEAVQWLRSRGIDQWENPWPSEDAMTAAILASIQARETFILREAQIPVATVTVDLWANPDLWTPSERVEPAFYLHRMIVRRAYAGQGLGAELLDWGGTRAARNRARWLRLDAWTTNQELQRYYARQGFQHVRTQALSHNPSGALFQRPARYSPTSRIQEQASHVHQPNVIRARLDLISVSSPR